MLEFLFVVVFCNLLQGVQIKNPPWCAVLRGVAGCYFMLYTVLPTTILILVPLDRKLLLADIHNYNLSAG